MFCLGMLLALGPVAGHQPACASGLSAVSQTVSTGTGSITVKLAPGADLVSKTDGTLTVAQDWASLNTADIDSLGLELKESGQLDSLDIRILAPASSALLGTAEDIDLEEAARVLRLMPGVLWAEVSRPLQACLAPNDPLYAAGGYTSIGQWGFPRTGFPSAWDITTGAGDVTVAVLDTGIGQDIADFSGRIVSPYNAITGSSAWSACQDNHGHGTSIAGVALAQGNNGQAIAGAAWGVKIMPVKISEAGESDTTTLARAIEYAVNNGADVINISFAGPDSTRTLSTAVGYALSRGVVIVAAAGNDGVSSISYPAACDGVVAVGATNRSDSRWTSTTGKGSNTGAELDIMAPGESIISFSDGSGSRYSSWNGTSLSAPLVAGAVALMLSVDPTLTPDEITLIINQTADDLGASGWDSEFGWGLLDADEAVAEAAGGGTTTTTSTTTTTTTTTTSTTTTSTTTTTTSSTTSTTQPSTTTTTEPYFADVSEATTPYWDEIGYLASLGVVSGSGSGLFVPQGTLMRQHFAKVIVRSLDLPVTGTEICPFGDVAAQTGSDPFYPYYYVAVAYAYGITNGTDSTHFSPYRMLTREQMITMVARAAKLAEPPASYTAPFPVFYDVHYPYARAAAYAGLLDGLEGMGPDYDFMALATRGEMCALICALIR